MKPTMLGERLGLARSLISIRRTKTPESGKDFLLLRVGSLHKLDEVFESLDRGEPVTDCPATEL